MAMNGKETKATSPETNKLVCQDVVTRIAEVPLVSSVYDNVSTTYAAAKDGLPLVKSVWNAAELGIKKVAAVAATGVKHILSNLEPQIAVVNEYACQGLDKLEEKLPILKQPVDKVISDTKGLLSSTVAGAKAVVYNTVVGAKNAVTVVVDRAKGAVQGSMEATKTVVTSGMSAIIGHAAVEKVTSILDVFLGRSADWVNHFLPITDEELAKLAIHFEGLNSVTVEQQKRQSSYYVRLGTLSTKLGWRAYQHSLAKMKEKKQNIQEMLSKIQRTIDLIEYSKQAADLKHYDIQENLNKMWLKWCVTEPGPDQKESSANPEQIESRVLVGLRNITEHLQATSCDLVSSIQGLPNNIQEHVRQVQNCLGDLHAYFSTAASFQDFSGDSISQSKQKVIKAQESLNRLLDYLVHNFPNRWLVGPFTPSEEPAGKINQPVAVSLNHK